MANIFLLQERFILLSRIYIHKYIYIYPHRNYNMYARASICIKKCVGGILIVIFLDGKTSVTVISLWTWWGIVCVCFFFPTALSSGRPTSLGFKSQALMLRTWLSQRKGDNPLLYPYNAKEWRTDLPQPRSPKNRNDSILRQRSKWKIKLLITVNFDLNLVISTVSLA